VEALGIEASETVELAAIHVDSRQLDPTRVDVSARSVVAFGPVAEYTHSTVEDALARAIEGSVAAGRWDVVMQLARELEARRLAAVGNVEKLDPNQRLRQ
jgi:hypothetical protein